MNALSGGLLDNFLTLFYNLGARNYPTRCYCPHCRQDLVSRGNMLSDDGDVVIYICAHCETRSRWLFSAPVPILLGP